MLRGTPARILIAAVLFLTLGGTLYAQAFGRMVLNIKDEEGNPVPDVLVVVTSDEITTFRQEKKSNKKGRVTVSVTDATRTYNLHLEHGAYPPFDTQIKLQLGTTTNRDITLSRGAVQAPQDDAAPAGAVVYTPAERIFNEGVELLQDGDMASAKTKFLEAAEKDPDLSLAHSALAGVYIEEKNYEAALASVTRFRELDPTSARGIRMLYEAHNGLGNEKEADKALEELKKFGGDDTAKMIFNEGVAATKVGDYAGAKDRFLEALELNPNMSESTGALAIIYFNEGSHAESAAMAERHLTLRPDDQKMMQVRYSAYLQAGDSAKASEAMQAMVDAGVNVDAILVQFLNQGLKYFEAGDSANAQAEFKKVLDINPNHAKAHYHLGISLVSSGDAEAAKTHLTKFLELAPEDPDAQTAKDMLSYL